MSKIFLISGPTASGKSEFAVRLAKKINGEIINADSMQIYKEIKILNTRPNKKLTNKIKHHLYGFHSVKKKFSVGHWLKLTNKSIKNILERKKIPIVVGAVTQLGILGCNIKNWNDNFIRKNPLFCPDKSIIKLWEKYLLSIRKAGSSCGAVIEVRAKGIPVGLGAPIYSKLDMDLASAMMSINAVKGVNIGSGMNSAKLTGEQNSDEIFKKGMSTNFKSNNAGGILGGISSGQEIIVSFAVKPTSSILTSRKTIDKFGKNTSISVKGRHDPCVGIRAVPIGEAMMNCVLLDHFLMNSAQCKS